MHAGTFIDSGCGDGFDPEWIDSWVHRAAEYAHGMALRAVLVMEKPMKGGAPFPGRSPATGGVVIGCRKLWIRRWQKHEQTVSKAVVSVYHSSWRARVLGMGRGGAGTELAEFARAKTISRRYVSKRDEAAAICIAQWGSSAGEVGSVLPKTTTGRVA